MTNVRTSQARPVTENTFPLNPIQTGVQTTTASNFFAITTIKDIFDNSQFISSLFNFHLVSNVTSYDVKITSLLSKIFFQNLADQK